MQVAKTSIYEKMPNQGIRFFIPPFQRAYSWEEENWEELFEDLKSVTQKDKPHFIGSVVIQKTSHNKTVIDGQQRLTTVSFLLLALAKWIKKNDSGNTFLYDDFIKSFLIMRLPNGTNATKIELSQKNDNCCFS